MSLPGAKENIMHFALGFIKDRARRTVWPIAPVVPGSELGPGPSKRVGPEKWCRTHTKVAPETNSKAVRVRYRFGRPIGS